MLFLWLSLWLLGMSFLSGLLIACPLCFPGVWTFRWKLTSPTLFLQFVYRLLSSPTDTRLNFSLRWIECHLSPLNQDSRWLCKIIRTTIVLRQKLNLSPVTVSKCTCNSFHAAIWEAGSGLGFTLPNGIFLMAWPAGCNQRLPLFENMSSALRECCWREPTSSTGKRRGQHPLLFI